MSELRVSFAWKVLSGDAVARWRASGHHAPRRAGGTGRFS